MEPVAPCSVHHQQCPPECKDSKKVIFLCNDQKYYKMNWQEAREICPLFESLETKTGDIQGVDDEECNVTLEHIDYDTLSLFMDIVQCTKTRVFPPPPIGTLGKETLALTSKERDLFLRMTFDQLKNVFIAALFFDAINIARLCSVHMAEKYIKGKSIEDIQEQFNLPRNPEPSHLYLDVMDKYGPCFHPERENLTVMNSHGDLLNYNGITCSGLCELENEVFKRYGGGGETYRW